MAEISKPDYTYLWSSGGSIVAPSNTKIQTGWTAEVPPFQWENWSQNRQDAAIVHMFQKGVSVWSSTQDYYFNVAGTRAYVQGSDGNIYVAVQNSLGQNPVTDTSNTYWQVAFSHPKGLVQFTTSGSFTVPAGITTLWVSGCGGGGGGGGTSSVTASSVGGAGGGGAGQCVIRFPYSVTPGQVLVVTIGAGGVGGTPGANGGQGGDTILGSIVTLGRGFGGAPGTVSTTAAGGGVGGAGFPTGADGADASNNSNGAGYGGHGGGGLYSPGGRITKGTGGAAAVGAAAPYYGGGGAGAGGINGNVTGVGASGGAGSAGILIIEW